MDIFRRVGLAGPPTYSRAKKRRRGRQIWPGALDERGPFGSTCCLTVSRDQRRRLVAFASCILLGDWRATHTERYPPPPPPSTRSQKLHKKRGEREREQEREWKVDGSVWNCRWRTTSHGWLQDELIYCHVNFLLPHSRFVTGLSVCL